jgi:hypothetical protein
MRLVSGRVPAHAAPPVWTALVLAQALSGCTVDRLGLEGFSRVEPVVVDELMPRALPGCITEAEQTELERRLWALGIFDDVSVTRRDRVLHVRVREKWTLIPTAEVGTAKTAADSYASVVVTESNVAGRAVECGAWVAYYQRAWTGEAWCAQHQGFARAPSFEGTLTSNGSGFSFEDAPYTWERRRTGGQVGVRLPFWYGTQWRFAWTLEGHQERLDGDLAPRLASEGLHLGFGMRAIWDRLSWNDLVPRGTRVFLSVHPGLFFRPGVDRPRHAFTSQSLTGFQLGARTALLVNLVAEGASPGDPNHSFLLGSVPSWRMFPIGGIRGLADNVNRNAVHAYGNLELRHAVKLAERWFLQGVAFVDGGVFARMDPLGDVEKARGAISVGGGLRVVPTLLAWLVPRVDAGRALAPAPSWFVLLGLSQYF